MLKKPLSFMVCAALCTALLAGCGDEGKNSSTSSGAPQLSSSQAGGTPSESIPETPPIMEEGGENLTPEPEEQTLIRASVLKGPTAIGTFAGV